MNDNIKSPKSGMGKCRPLTVAVSVTDTEMFKDVLGIVTYAYEQSDGEVKKEIYNRVNNILSKKYDLENILHPPVI